MASAKINLGSVGTLSCRSTTSRPYIKVTRQASGLIDDEIEEDPAGTSDSEGHPWPTERRLTDDILEIANGLPTEAIETPGQVSKRTYNMLGAEDASLQQPKVSDILVPSTLSQEEERESSISVDFPDIVKRPLTLETMGQLQKRLNDEDTRVEEARSALIEAQVKEFRAKVEKCAIERVLGNVERSVRQLQAASYHPAMSRAEDNQGDAVVDSILANLRAELEKASESKAKKDVLSVVLKDQCEELETSRQSVKEYEHRVKVLMEDLEKRQRAFELQRQLTASLLCADPETGVFGTELEFQLRQLDRGLLDTDSGRFSFSI